MKILTDSLPAAAKTLVFAMILAFVGQPAGAQDRVDVLVEYEKGDLHDIQSQYEHKGVVIVDPAGQDEEPNSLPLEVVAKLDFAQRFTGNGDSTSSDSILPRCPGQHPN